MRSRGVPLLIEVDDVGLGKDAAAPRSRGRLGLSRYLRELLDGGVVEGACAYVPGRSRNQPRTCGRGYSPQCGVCLSAHRAPGSGTAGIPSPSRRWNAQPDKPGAAGSSESDRLVERFDSQGLAERATGSTRGSQADPGRRSAVAKGLQNFPGGVQRSAADRQKEATVSTAPSSWRGPP